MALLCESVLDEELELCHFFLEKSKAFPEALFVVQDHTMVPKVHHPEKWMIDLDNMMFFKLFRMEKNTFNAFIRALHVDNNDLLNKKYSGGHFPVNESIKVLVFLNYMATQESLLSIGHRFQLSTSTVMDIVNVVLYLVLKLKRRYIKFPSIEELEDVSNGFPNYPSEQNQKYAYILVIGIPRGVVGAVDGTHIFISVSDQHQDSYIDRYRRHSINIMAICESHKLFTYIFVGFPGAAHDSRLFENSLLFKNIEKYGSKKYFREEKYHLIGDSAFSLRKWLMVPYRDNGNLSRVQKRHNYLLSSERVKIEHTFGMLKQRWRRLQYIVTYNICKTIEISTAGCVLHNFCLLHNDIWNEEPATATEREEAEGNLYI